MMNKLIYYFKRNYAVRNIVLALSVLFIIITSSFILLDIYTKHGEKFVVPNLSGLSIDEARGKIKEMDSQLIIIDSLFIPRQKAGIILEQNPKAGSFVKTNRRILLTINSTTPQKIILPYVTGYSLRQAKNRLISVGIGISRITYKEDIATNNVIAQVYNDKTVSPDSKINIPIGGEVQLIVGLATNEPKIKIPSTIGLTISDAKSILWENGFNIGKIHYGSDVSDKFNNDIRVYKQSITPEHYAKHGHSVKLHATSDKLELDKSMKQVQDYYNKITNIENEIGKYNDTLQVLRVKIGNNTIINKHGIVAPADSLFYKQRIEDLKYTLRIITLE